MARGYGHQEYVGELIKKFLILIDFIDCNFNFDSPFYEIESFPLPKSDNFTYFYFFDQNETKEISSRIRLILTMT